MTMTPKQRMLAAYRGELPDYVPVAPEFWYYLPARLLGLDMIEFGRVPHWQALQQTFKHYGTEGWGAAFSGAPCPDVEYSSERTDLPEGRILTRSTRTTKYGALTQAWMADPKEPGWEVERPIKEFARDWPAYKASTLGIVEEINWTGVQQALDAVGEDYLLEVWLPGQFFDYIAGGREGGFEQGIYDLMEHEEFFEALHEEYLDYVRRYTEAACTHTTGESLVIGCAWSCISLISPAMWRRWDWPVVRAMADVAHAHGRLLHIHFHGKCMDSLADLATCGADCVCPFERPPGGDVTDLGVVRRALGDRVTVNGNVHTVETLIRGTAADVRREVAEIFEQWGPDKRRLIVGTGDQVGGETPDENIYAMIEACRELGKTG
ncbi:MAG: methylcobalamin:coenzyme M methyltransferase [bacterium ADurb.Bin429]|nr:MAG: methylcobalamin:coenzyme M methyltransferase [bacterium ADurb.Bin429]